MLVFSLFFQHYFGRFIYFQIEFWLVFVCALLRAYHAAIYFVSDFLLLRACRLPHIHNF